MFATKLGPSALFNPFGNILYNADPLEVQTFGGALVTIADIYRMMGNLLISECAVWYVGVEVVDNIKVKVDSTIWYV